MKTNEQDLKLSIVTPSFNRGWCIESCISSVSSQSYPPFEHYIIDGGSSDNTENVVNANTFEYLEFHAVNDSGMYDAINQGFAKCTGDVFAYINTDDFYLPAAFETVMDLFRKDTELDLVYGNWVSWHPKKRFIEFLPVRFYSPDEVAQFANLPQPAVFFRSRVFEEFKGFDCSYSLVADNDFFSKIIVSGKKYKFVDEYIAVQTLHEGNLLNGQGAESVDDAAMTEITRFRRARQYELWDGSETSIFFRSRRAVVSERIEFVRIRIRLMRHIIKSILFAGKGDRSLLKQVPSFKAIGFLKYLLERGPVKNNTYNKTQPHELEDIIGFPPVRVKDASH